MSNKISVIIPTHNREEMVANCVESVFNTKYDNLEVIVVDDCSVDNTKCRLYSKFGSDARFKYLRNERNLFQAVSRNRGASISTGDYLFFLDDDNIVDKNILSELVACFERNEDAGLVAPMAIHNPEMKIWTLGSDFSKWTSRPMEHMPNVPIESFANDDKIDYETTYSPNAFMVHRRVFQITGGFDESYVCIFEESDFGWRIMQLGYKGYICAKAITNHYGHMEGGYDRDLRFLGIEHSTRAYYFGRNRMRFAMRHFSWYHIVSVATIFAPLSVLWYGYVALKKKRKDIAYAYFKGTIRGIFGLK